jgi:hypothetical protein
MRDLFKEIFKIVFIESFRAIAIIFSFIITLITLQFLVALFNNNPKNYESGKEKYR